MLAEKLLMINEKHDLEPSIPKGILMKTALIRSYCMQYSLLFFTMFIWSMLAGVVQAESASLKVFAAASTTNAVTDICDLFAKEKGISPQISFASSSTLAKQIENGAPADIYISANVKWMDYLEKFNAIAPESRTILLKNRLVLIVPQPSPVNRIDISPNMNLLPFIDKGFLSMGDPDHVPAGMYAKDALEQLGIYGTVEKKIARCSTVRAALAMVERGEAQMGVVYSTDAALTDKVKVVGMFPENLHPPIIYPAAIVKGHDSDAARQFMLFLKSAEAETIFKTYGFIVVK